MFIAYFILCLWIVVFELLRKKKDNFFIDYLSIFHFYFFLFYTVPGFFLNLPYGMNKPYMDPVFGEIPEGSVAALLAISLAYILILSAYYFGLSLKLKSLLKAKKIGNSIQWHIIIMIGCISLGMIAMYVYSSQYGGLYNAIALANYIRAKAVEPGKFSFFIRFLPFASWGCYLGVAYLLFQKRIFLEKWVGVFLLIITIGLFCVNTLLLAGRATILNAGVVLIIVYSLYRRQQVTKLLLTLVPFAILILLFGKDVFRTLHDLSVSWDYFIKGLNANVSAKENPFANLIIYFEFNYVSLEIYLNEVIYTSTEWRWMIDWVYGFLGLIPKLLFPISINTDYNGSFVNTENVVGLVDYEVPPGLLAASFYSMDWLGLVLCSLFYGFFGGILDKILRGLIKQAYWASVVYASAGVMWGSFTSHGDPSNLFQGHFVSFCVIGFFLIYGTKILIQRDANRMYFSNQAKQ